MEMIRAPILRRLLGSYLQRAQNSAWQRVNAQETLVILISVSLERRNFLDITEQGIDLFLNGLLHWKLGDAIAKY